MNIVHIITSLESGGTEKNLMNLIQFDNNRNKHTVFALKPHGFYEKTLKKKVKVYSPKNKKILSFLFFFFFLTKYCKINQIKIDVVYSWGYHANLISIFTNVKNKIWNIRSSGEKILSSPKRLMWVILNGIFSIFSSKIIFNSYKSKKQHSPYFINKNFKTIQNGFIFSLKKRKFKKINHINYLCIARNNFYKDHKNLIKSFILFDKKFKDWKLFIIGKDNKNLLLNFSFSLNKNFKKKIVLVNETKDLNKYLSIANFHVLSSLGESFPNAVGETMSSGILNIATNVGDTKYLIKEKNFLVEPENPRKLFDALIKSKNLYLNNYNNYKKKSEQIKKYIYKNFSYENYYNLLMLETKKLFLKKFLFVLPTLNTGGAEKVTTEIIQKINSINKSITTDILVIGKKHRLDYKKKFDGKIFYLNKKKTFFSFFSLYKFIYINNYKYIFSNIPNANALMNIIKFFSIRKFNLIVRESNMPFEPLKHRFSLKHFFDFILRFFYFNSDMIICPSKQIYDNLNRMLFLKSKNKFIHLPNYINFDENKKESMKKLKGKLYKKNYILNISNINFQKNIEFSIKAFNFLLKSKPNFNLVIIGKVLDKNYYKSIRRLVEKLGIKNKVFFLGFKENPFNIISKAKMVICTSRWEGMPNSLLQAVSLNKKIASLNCNSGPFEIKKCGFNIDIVFKNDTELFSKKINKLLVSKNKIKNYEKIKKYNLKHDEQVKYILNYDF